MFDTPPSMLFLELCFVSIVKYSSMFCVRYIFLHFNFFQQPPIGLFYFLCGSLLLKDFAPDIMIEKMIFTSFFISYHVHASTWNMFYYVSLYPIDFYTTSISSGCLLPNNTYSLIVRPLCCQFFCSARKLWAPKTGWNKDQ